MDFTEDLDVAKQFISKVDHNSDLAPGSLKIIDAPEDVQGGLN